ncbi:prepilin-type N-terminal cleavage/methylation domain-containing protein [Orenia metallireducens]|uniref:Prepilin-type N-terminal cleavage/methylation domain-containing protein n=1 Tax=Orenia metallireducens TaxID=1413210 RepID=A0A285I5B5_9FIRM|nr:prepilin-type N-terminal cleavage/methylation domain-containing protein [Orenia metallireducens]PRX19723.1 prepilin-type N-terminal cleavage/methylation domain-containing protein [Orenia metallireducens]SNY43158.1 prepilin-type N-terminal cleavage/methylation domain-containing protein [Orenia metallireducens]
MDYNLNDEAGFTMIELLVALSILTMILLPLTKLLIDNSTKIIEAKQLTIATNLARLKLEEERAKVFGDINSRALAEIGEGGFTNYKYLVEVDSIETEVKEIIVKVYFKETLRAELITFIRDV